MATKTPTLDLPRHTLTRCYDDLVTLAGANRTHFSDTLYSTWYVRRGEIRLDWDDGGTTVRGGHWIFCDPIFTRSQFFKIDVHIVSVGVQISWAGRETICPPRPPLAVRASKLPGLLPAAEALVAAQKFVEEAGPGENLSLHCRMEARFQDWLAAWYIARKKIGRGPVAPAARDARLERVLLVLQQQTSRDAVPYEKLKRAVGLSRAQIDRLFRDAFGMTPRHWCDRALQARAEQLLARDAMPIKQISHQLGFVDPSHFAKWFKQHSKMSPLTFRRGGWS